MHGPRRIAPFALVLIPGALLGCSCSAPESVTWQIGKTYRYDVAMTTEARAEAAAAEPMFDFALDGEIEVTPLEVSKDGYRLRIAFARAAFTTTQGQAAQERFAQVAADLRRPHAFAFASGRQIEATIAKDTHALGVGILRNVAAQFQRPELPSGKTEIETEEHDATGRYLARYELTHKGPASKATMVKQKLRYVGLIVDERVRSMLAQRSTAMPAIDSAKGSIELDGDVLRTARASEVIALELLAGRALKTHTTVALSYRGQGPAATRGADATPGEVVTLAAGEPYVHASATFDFDQAKIGDRTFDQVIAELEALAKQRASGVPTTNSRNGEPSPASDVEAGKVFTGKNLASFVALSAMLRKSRTNVDAVVALVRGDSPALSALLSALGAAGSDYAQGALIELAKDGKLPRRTRRAAAFSLLRTKNPTIASAEALSAWLDDAEWRSYAELGLGTYVRHFRDTGATAAMTRFGDLLVAHLHTRGSNRERADALLGLSNAGYAAALPAIRGYLGDASPEVRAAAVQSLRLVRHPDVDALIVGALRRDPERDVRIAALSAMANREVTEELAAAAAHGLSADADSSVRIAAIELIVQWGGERAELRAALERAAANDDTEAVQRAARDALARLAPSAAL